MDEQNALMNQLTAQITQAVSASINNVFNQFSAKQEITDNRLAVVEKRLEQEVTLNYKEQVAVQQASREKVIGLLFQRYGNVKITDEIKTVRHKLYSRMGHALKLRFMVGSYKDIKHHELSDAVIFIQNWQPDWKSILGEYLRVV